MEVEKKADLKINKASSLAVQFRESGVKFSYAFTTTTTNRCGCCPSAHAWYRRSSCRRYKNNVSVTEQKDKQQLSTWLRPTDRLIQNSNTTTIDTG